MESDSRTGIRLYPVAMTTYQRWDYLAETYVSYKDSDAPLEMLHIFDDHSDSKLQHGFLMYLRQEGHFVKTNGHRLGTYQNVYNAITKMVEIYETEYILYVQDDVRFYDRWYSRAIELFGEINDRYQDVALLSLCNLRCDFDSDYDVISKGHPGGVGWILNRYFWSAYRERWPSKYPKRPNLADWAICSNAKQMGYKIFCVRDSLILHTGKKSSILDTDGNVRDMSMWTGKNYCGNRTK